MIFFGCRILQNLFTKKTSISINGSTQLLIYTAYQYMVSMVLSILLLPATDSIQLSPTAILISFIGGIAMFCSSMSSLMALQKGSLFILTSLASSMSIVIPTVASTFLFHEPMSIWQVLGVCVLLYASYLLLGCSKEMYKQFSVKTVLYLLGIFTAEGITMLSQKCYVGYVSGEGVAVFNFLAFGTAFVLTAIMSVGGIYKDRVSIRKVMNKELLTCGAVLASMLFLVMYLGTIGASLVPAVVLYSLVAGGSLIMATLVSTVAFKEPLTKKNITGILISIAALIVINIF